MRISTSADRPTVSIQNGLPICLLISSESAWSSSEKNGFGPGGGSSSAGSKSTVKAEPLLRDAVHVRVIGVLRIALVDVDQRGDVLHDGCRQPLRHRVPVALHEHEGDDRLQQDHRRDDDEQRAAHKGPSASRS